MLDPRSCVFELPAARPAMSKLPEQWYPGVHGLWSTSSTERSVDPLLGIRAVVIHATTGLDSAGAMSAMKAGRASWHWLLPDENEDRHGETVWACTPEARTARHVRPTRSHPMVNDGGRRINDWSLGIRVVSLRDRRGSDPFSAWQVEMAAAIVRYCWAKYPNLRSVVLDTALDPERRAGGDVHFDWQRFRALVLHGDSKALDAPKLVRLLVPNNDAQSPGERLADGRRRRAHRYIDAAAALQMRHGGTFDLQAQRSSFESFRNGLSGAGASSAGSPGASRAAAAAAPGWPAQSGPAPRQPAALLHYAPKPAGGKTGPGQGQSAPRQTGREAAERLSQIRAGLRQQRAGCRLHPTGPAGHSRSGLVEIVRDGHNDNRNDEQQCWCSGARCGSHSWRRSRSCRRCVPLQWPRDITKPR